MNKTAYVVRMADDWDSDFVRVYTTLKKTAKAISEMFLDDGYYIDEDEVYKQMKTREKECYTYLFLPEEIDKKFEDNPRFAYRVMACTLDN